MSKIIFINENYRLLQKSKSVLEGGLARNIALMKWFQNNIVGLVEIKLKKNRINNFFKVLIVLIFNRNKTILFQYVTVGIPLFNRTVFGKISSFIFLRSVKISSIFNDIIFDVSDLKYEQSIDLKIQNGKIKLMQKFEEFFFKLDVKFLFSSFSMQEYACHKYNISKEKNEVIINGGYISNLNYSDIIEINSNFVNCVYAGTLNKGRSIEEMIKNFPIEKGYKLYLLGIDGDWINKEVRRENIIYLGSYAQDIAHQIVSNCDLGLIPYDSTKKYYNIAFPTKLSFYITAGIPFLSTCVNEVMKITEKYQVGYTDDICNWTNKIRNLSKENLLNEKIKITNIMQDFEWDNIISRSIFLKFTE
jgi:glycosyltransferase involved in cell wall biosynthesis